MNIKTLRRPEHLPAQSSLNKRFIQFSDLTGELNTRNLTEDTVIFINSAIDEINAVTESHRRLNRCLRQKRSAILKLIKDRHKIVPKNYHRDLWLILGIAIYGIPIETSLAIGAADPNLLSLGLPIGLAIGIPIGSEKDKKAFREGRQLKTSLDDTICM